MFTHPDIAAVLVKQHQADLQAKAAGRRLGKRASSKRKPKIVMLLAGRSIASAAARRATLAEFADRQQLPTVKNY